MKKRSYEVPTLLKAKPLMFFKIKQFARYPLQMPKASRALAQSEEYVVAFQSIQGYLAFNVQLSKKSPFNHLLFEVLLISQSLSMGVSAFFWIAVLFLGCEGRPDGAPLSACSSLTPLHSGISPQRTAAPFTVSVSKHGNTVRVKLFSSVGEEFEGFVLQARYSNDRSRLVDGHFTTKDGVTKTIDCFNGRQNTLTFVNPTRKREVVTDWTANTALDEDVIFRATFAKTFALFWTEVDSPPVRILNDGPSGSRSAPKRADPNYKTYGGCSISKGCFGIPSGCINREDCEVLVSYAKSRDGISFQMHGILEDNTYMAMGLSRDNKMGDDGVIECVRRESKISARRSWNVGNGKSNNLLNELQDGDYESEFVNGMSTCSFTLSYMTEINGRAFNLANDTHYTLLAKGPMRNERLSYHSLRESTQQPVNFNAFEVSEGEGVTDSIKIHGLTEESFLSNITDSFSTEVTVDVTPSSHSSGYGPYLSHSLSFVVAILGLLHVARVFGCTEL
ncbi:Putative ferric-chelate reductase 1 [Araneus ventricosus]|uniref:Ferric-chelate reductase 1 n=1 Tax=Araneus ventricosus TaxID=182803 RepID=A0A4Y2AMU8_ARAVE|nr:Putative ferric-chelate reductase 1 [Araneus ventricosus]